MDENEMRQRATNDRDCIYFFPFRDLCVFMKERSPILLQLHCRQGIQTMVRGVMFILFGGTRKTVYEEQLWRKTLL